MSGSAKNQSASSRELTLSFDQAAFALIGVTQRAGSLPPEIQKNFSSDVTIALRRLMLHDKKVPTRFTEFKREKHSTRKMVDRETACGLGLARNFDEMSAEQSVGLALTAINHAACLPSYRAAFDENKEDYFSNDDTYHSFNEHLPMRIRVSKPESRGLLQMFSSKNAMDEVVENVKAAFSKSSENAFYDALYEDAAVALDEFREQTAELWKKARAENPRPTAPSLLKAS